MLKKKERLTKKEFDRSFSLGKRKHTPYVQIIHHPSPTFHGAAVVGKKVYKKAVHRNRLRRQMYGTLYRYHQKNSIPGTVILVAKPAVKEIPQKKVSQVVGEALDSVSW